MEMPDVPFLSARQILEAMDKYQFKNFGDLLVFKGEEEGAVVMEIKRIRIALEKAGFRAGLIGNGPEGRGYRLETPPENLGLE